MFTFIIDATLMIKSAVLDLRNMSTKPQSEGQTHPDTMPYAMQLAYNDHKIDRLHLKCATVTKDGRIAVVGRGKPD